MKQFKDYNLQLTDANSLWLLERKPAIPDLGRLLKVVRHNKFISETDLHCEQHWKRVTLNGFWIADQVNGADKEIIFLFGLLHDCRRQEEGGDKLHGPRAAKATEYFLESGLIDLEPNRMAVLVKALSEHSVSRTSDNPTIGCCWDADRYDILRIFERVKLSRLSHPNIATPERLDAAYYNQETIEESWSDLFQRV
jgi:hypothetical protein